MIKTEIPVSEDRSITLYDRVRNRALGQNQFDFQPYSCYIEYKLSDTLTGLQYRDCVVDYTKCTNKKCIKKIT